MNRTDDYGSIQRVFSLRAQRRFIAIARVRNENRISYGNETFKTFKHKKKTKKKKSELSNLSEYRNKVLL